MRARAFLLTELIRRDLASRFAGSLGGAAWLLIGPAVLCGLYAFVFGAILRVPPPAGFPGGFPEFLLAGLVPWMGTSEALLRGASSVTDNAELVKKNRFPVAALVASALGSALLVEMAGLALIAGWSALRGSGTVRPGWLLFALGFQAILLAGPLLLLAAVNVFVRDLPQILAPALTVTFYLTPVVYPADLVPTAFRAFLAANPFAAMVEAFRTALFGAPPPDSGALVAWTVAGCVLASAGFAAFRRLARSFPDFL